MQSQILNLLLDLHYALGLTILFITHDLSVVRQVADRVVVLYLGRTMEVCTADAFFADRHPYSEALMRSTPRLHLAADEYEILAGEIPSLVRPPAGCPFVTRCRRRCRTAMTHRRGCARFAVATSSPVFSTTKVEWFWGWPPHHFDIWAGIRAEYEGLPRRCQVRKSPRPR